MQRLFIFFLSLRGIFVAAIHVKKKHAKGASMHAKGASIGPEMMIPQPDGTFRVDATKVAPIKLLIPHSLGYCATLPGSKWVPPAEDEEYFTIKAGHQHWLDTKPNTGCDECMEIMKSIIVEADDTRECTDLRNRTSACMLGRSGTLSASRLAEDPDRMSNFQLACRCQKKYGCNLIAPSAYQALMKWEFDMMVHGKEYSKMSDVLEDTLNPELDAKKAADFDPDIGVHTDMGAPNADNMYGLNGLTGANNARDSANADHNAGMRGRDLMRDSGDNWAGESGETRYFSSTGSGLV